MKSTENLHSRDSDRVLIIMAKAPRAGSVKTRLTQTIAVEAVTDLYRCLLNDTLALAHSMEGVEVAIMCPECDLTALNDFVGATTRIVPQQGDGLAAALTSVFAHFAGSGKRVIAFNSDSPHLPAAILEKGFELLLTHDVVVGPTHDGGYYLVGANTAHPGLFNGDGMGTTSALDRLLGSARNLQLSVGITDQFYDVDIYDDLARLAAELQLHPTRAPRTAEWLENWQQASSRLKSTVADL